MQNDKRAALRAEALRLEQVFLDAGALKIEADSLLPAGTLLDLYGEDIRARAYVTTDPVAGEMMMRPDFTVPIVERHMAEGAEPARYTYNGMVWRKQTALSARASEFLQVGFELFDRKDPAIADAEVFALFAKTLPAGMSVSTGDIGLLRAAVLGLDTPDWRKTALLRHLWRPARFEQLLAEYAGRTDQGLTSRNEMLADLEGKNIAETIKATGPLIGLRSVGEIATRIDVLYDEAATAPIKPVEFDLLQDLFAMSCSTSAALDQLRQLANSHELLGAAVDVFAERVQALADKGIDVNTLPFVGNYGRTSMEYYDGFVFGFSSGDRVVATGGRYDALTSVLGQGRAIAAVGGVIRPDELLAVKGGK